MENYTFLNRNFRLAFLTTYLCVGFQRQFDIGFCPTFEDCFSYGGAQYYPMVVTLTWIFNIYSRYILVIAPIPHVRGWYLMSSIYPSS